MRGAPWTPKLGKVYRGDNGIAWIHKMRMRVGCVRDDDDELNGRVGGLVGTGGNKAEAPSIPT